jgi:transcriptional regulator GlxA family with amidase domain
VAPSLGSDRHHRLRGRRRTGVIGPLEVLRRAAQSGADLTVQLVTRSAVEHVTGSCGLRFQPDTVFTPDADVVMVPGGGWVARDDNGAWGEVRRGDWLPLLAPAAGQGSVMAGVCTGTMLLAHAGIVGNAPARPADPPAIPGALTPAQNPPA